MISYIEYRITDMYVISGKAVLDNDKEIEFTYHTITENFLSIDDIAYSQIIKSEITQERNSGYEEYDVCDNN